MRGRKLARQSRSAFPSIDRSSRPPEMTPRMVFELFQKHNEECCVDTLPRRETQPDPDEVGGPAPALGAEGQGGRDGGGRGLCFRDAFQRYADPPGWEALGSPDVVYFGSGLHFLHMCGPGKRLEPQRVQG